MIKTFGGMIIMKLIIDIPNEVYDWLVNGFPDEEDAVRLLDIVKNGTPLEESEDCVSLDAVIDVFDTWWMNNHETDNAIDVLEEKLNALPHVTPKQSFESMTNGEVLGTLFPVISMRLFDEVFELEWWKAPYKGDY